MKYRRVVREARDRGIVHTVNALRAASLTPGNARSLGKLNAREFHTILRNIFSYRRKYRESMPLARRITRINQGESRSIPYAEHWIPAKRCVGKY